MTIWYDFTTTLRNTGRNGIANVEWSIGTALIESSSDVRCFALGDLGRLREIDPTRDLGGAVYADAAATPSGANFGTPTWRDRARYVLRDTLGPRSTPVIRTMSNVYQFPKRAVSAVRRPSRSRTTTRSAPQLVDLVLPGDIVISLGADWEGVLASKLGDLRRQTGCQLVTMVYDLIPLTHTHLAFHKDPALFEAYYKGLLVVSDLITCISEQSRQDLLRFAARIGVPAPGTEVLTLGEAVEIDHLGTELAAAVDHRDFYLWVGTIERRKNLELIYDALRILEMEGAAVPTVVVAGAIGWGVDDLIIEIGSRSTEASRAMVTVGSVDERTLAGLYQRANALLFPSHYEGWGLPVREAAVRGCPVAAGDSPAVREDAAGYPGATPLPVDDPGPWADYLRRVPQRCEAAPVFTWGQSAAMLEALIRGLR